MRSNECVIEQEYDCAVGWALNIKIYDYNCRSAV